MSDEERIMHALTVAAIGGDVAAARELRAWQDRGTEGREERERRELAREQREAVLDALVALAQPPRDEAAEE